MHAPWARNETTSAETAPWQRPRTLTVKGRDTYLLWPVKYAAIGTQFACLSIRFAVLRFPSSTTSTPHPMAVLPCVAWLVFQLHVPQTKSINPVLQLRSIFIVDDKARITAQAFCPKPLLNPPNISGKTGAPFSHLPTGGRAGAR